MLRYLLEKEFKQFFRNSFLPKLVVILPLFVILIFPLVANFDVKNINLAIIDLDKSPLSVRLINKASSSGYFRLVDLPDNYNQAISGVESNQIDMILEIPMDFEKMLIKSQQAPVMISADAVNGVKGGLGSSYLNNVLFDFSNEIRTELNPVNAKLIIPSLEVIPQYRFNPRLKYYIFIIPALIVMMLGMVCGFLPALNIVSEKENGTIEQMNVTPVGRFSFILSKLIPYWVIGFVALTICILIAWICYGLTPIGSLFTIYLLSTVFLLAFSGFGLVVSNYAKTVQQAMFMMFFFVLTFIFMSGLYTPVDNMPSWAQLFSNISPLKYIIQAIRLIYLKGSSFFDVLPYFTWLCGFAVFFNLWAVISYRKTN